DQMIWPNRRVRFGRRAGKWSGGGGERLAKRSRSATPLPSRRRKPVADATVEAIPLATSARGVGPRGRRSTVEMERALVAAWQAREWFHLPGFPALLGKVFWADFVLWRRSQNRPKSLPSCNASKNA